MPVAGAFQSGVLKILCPFESNEELPAVEPIRMHQKSTQKMYSLVCSPARDPIQVCLSEFRHLIAGAIEVLLRSTRRPLCTAVQTTRLPMSRMSHLRNPFLRRFLGKLDKMLIRLHFAYKHQCRWKILTDLRTRAAVGR